MPRPRPRAAALAPSPAGGAEALPCRCRRSRSSAAAPTPGGGSTSRISWWSARAPRALPRRWTGPPRSIAPPGALMAEAGKLKGVADEGGFWPDFATNEEALEMLVRAIERAGLRAGEQVAIALDVAASEFGRSGRYRLGLEGRELDRDGMIVLLTGLARALPDRLDRGSAGRGRSRRLRRVHRRGRRARAGGRRRSHGDRCRRACARWPAAAPRNTLLVKPNQRGTLTETRAAWDAARAAGWGAHRLGALGRDRGRDDRPPRGRLGRAQLKVGSFARSERMAKWNEALRIEEALGAAARLAPAVPGLTLPVRARPPTAAALAGPGPRLPLVWNCNNARVARRPATAAASRPPRAAAQSGREGCREPGEAKAWPKPFT